MSNLHSERVNTIVERLEETLFEDETCAQAAHEFACERVGIEPRDLTEADEIEPWYDHYWLYISEFHAIVVGRVLDKVVFRLTDN